MSEDLVWYEIRIEGHLAPHRLRHYEGVTVREEAGGETLIHGGFRGQAALYGLLNWLQRLGVTLVLVRQLGEGQCGAEIQPVESEQKSARAG